MNIYLLTLIAAASNVGTVICIKKCKFVVLSGNPMVFWLLGIAASIVCTQFLLLWADVKGASLGLAVAFVVVFVMVTAAFLDTEPETGRLILISLKGVPMLQIVGYALAVLGVLFIGISQQFQSADPVMNPEVPLHGSNQ
jgi:hypothetical protein